MAARATLPSATVQALCYERKPSAVRGECPACFVCMIHGY